MVEVVSLVTSLVVLVTALVGLRAISQKVEKVHVLVNSQMTTALDRIEQLETALLGSDTEVPPAP